MIKDKEPNYTFSEALELLKEGKAMRLSYWKEAYVVMSMPKSSHFLMAGTTHCTKITVADPYIVFINKNHHCVVGWKPNFKEMTSNLWVIKDMDNYEYEKKQQMMADGYPVGELVDYLNEPPKKAYYNSMCSTSLMKIGKKLQ